MAYHVIEEPVGHWCYVVGDAGEPMPEDSGPWRYKWEAQEYADELNGKAPPPNISPDT